MRLAVIVLAAIATLALGALQAISATALRESAASASVARSLPGTVVDAVARLRPQPYQPAILRYVLGNWAVARNDDASAERFARSLTPGPDRDVLEGAVALARGRAPLAISKFLDAGDLPRLQRLVDNIALAGHPSAAADLEHALIARLHDRRAQNDTIAEATYHMGLLDQSVAYTFVPSDARRDAWQRRSRDAYAEAFRLAPLEDRYGIALGNQELNVGDLAAARAAFARVRDLDPASVEPYTGLADAAMRASDYEGAAAYLDQADRVAPGSPVVAQMRARLSRE